MTMFTWPAGGRARAAATLRVLRADFFQRVVMRHDTGLGEAYMAGDFEVRGSGLRVFCRAHASFVAAQGAGKAHMAGPLRWALYPCLSCGSPT